MALNAEVPVISHFIWLACRQSHSISHVIEFIDLLDSWNLISILISLSLQCKLEHEIYLRHLVARSKHGEKAVKHCFILEKCL